MPPELKKASFMKMSGAFFVFRDDSGTVELLEMFFNSK